MVSYRDYRLSFIRVIFGLYWVYRGIMEKNRETTGVL